MKSNTQLAVLVGLVLLVAFSVAFAQLSEMDRTTVFRDDIVRFGTLVTMCHIPPGNPENAQTIEVAQAAVPAHLAHGDLTGECPFECDGVPSAVGQTGQTNCWNSSGVLIGCGGTGQDGEHKAGVSVEPRFTDNGDGTVTDNLTGLIWLRNANCWEVPFEVVETWNWALQKANALETGWCGLTDGSTAGDWRLPNIRELQSLIDYGEYDPALPGGHPFSAVQSSCYWSSNTVDVRCSGGGPDCPSLEEWLARQAWFLRVRPEFDMYPSIEMGHTAKGTYLPDPCDGCTPFVQGARCAVWPVRGGQ